MTQTERDESQATTERAVREAGARVGAVIGASMNLVGNVLRNVGRLVDDTVRDATSIAADGAALYDAADGTVRAGSRVFEVAARAAPRFVRLVGEGARLMAAYRMNRMRAEIVDEATARADLEALHRAGAERIFRMCVELRGGVLKLGQIASCRADLLPPAYVEALSRLQDRVPAVDGDAIVARIEEELGAPIAECFARFDREPIAAASLAQVHAAALLDGTEVVVKVQVPGIAEIMEADLAAMRALVKIAGDLVPGVDLALVVQELGRAVAQELDYEAEAQNALGFAAAFAGHPAVVVPRVHGELSTARLLVMERIEGERIGDYLDGCEARGDEGAAERDRLLGVLLDCFCAQVLRHGLLQGDPHPGNFLVTPDGRLALLDFGCVQRFGAAERRAYAHVAGAILRGDRQAMAVNLAAMGFRIRTAADASDAPDSDPTAGQEGLLEIAGMVLEAFRESAGGFGSFDPKAQMARALEILRDSPRIETPPSFILLGRVFGTLAGLFLRYQPRLQPFAIIGPHLAGAMVA